MDTQAVIERVAKDLKEIHIEKKTWPVTGRAFTGRDGVAYKQGDKAPKSNVRVAKWSLASDLFTIETAKAFAKFVTAHANGTALIGAMVDNAELVSKYNHEDRFAAFIGLMAYAETAKAIKAEKVNEIITNAKTAKAVTVKTATVTDLSILGL